MREHNPRWVNVARGDTAWVTVSFLTSLGLTRPPGRAIMGRYRVAPGNVVVSDDGRADRVDLHFDPLP
jgi:hypothetical protein